MSISTQQKVVNIRHCAYPYLWISWAQIIFGKDEINKSVDTIPRVYSPQLVQMVKVRNEKPLQKVTRGAN